MDLQYPKWAPTPAGTSKGSMPAVAEGQSQGTRFGEVLAASLRAEGETRAWFNDQLKYQYVRQTRELLDFPQVAFLHRLIQQSLLGQLLSGPSTRLPLLAPWTMLQLVHHQVYIEIER